MQFLDRNQRGEPPGADMPHEEDDLRRTQRAEMAERRVRLVSAALAVAVVALVTSVALAFLWQQQIRRANANLKLVLEGARSTIHTIQQAYDLGSINLDLALKLIDDTSATANKVPKEQEDPQTRHVHLLLADVLSETYLKIGNVTQALASAEQEVAIATSLVGGDSGRDEWQYDLARSYYRIGEVRVDRGELIAVADKSNALTAALDATSAFQKFLGIVEALAVKYPRDEELQRDLSKGYDRTGDVAQLTGDLDGALASYGRRLRVALGNNRADIHWQWDEAVSRLNIGDILLAKGEVAGAAEQFEQFRATMLKLVAMDKDKVNARWRWNHALGHERLGDVAMRRGDLDAAIRSYNVFLALVGQLVEQDAANSEWQRGLAIANERIGDAQLALADAREQSGDAGSAATLRTAAQNAYAKDRRIAVSLAEKDASNKTFRRDLSISEEKAGDALLAQGNLDGALARYRAYNRHAAALVAEDAANADWQRDLAVSHQRIGDTLAKKSETRAARDAFQACSGALAKYGRPVKPYDPRNRSPDDIAQHCRIAIERLDKQLAEGPAKP